MSAGRTAEVAVLGGGPAGAACAAELARAGASVVMVHDGRARSWPGESLPPGSTGVITSVFGPILDEHLGHRVAAGLRSAWGSADLVEVDFIRDPSDDAWILDRSRFDADARGAARNLGVHVIDGRARTPRRDGSTWRIPLASADVLHARILVDATGRPASIARRLGMQVRRRDRLVALVSTGLAAPGSRTGTLIESVPEGWWYATVLNDRAIVAFLTDTDLLPPSLDRGEVWQSLLRQTLHVSCVAEQLPEPILCRADSSVGIPPCGVGWFAVGDAGAAWDPLSSQGLLSGILLGAQAARAITQGTPSAWAEDVRMLIDDTWSLQAQYYGQERRWPGADFWSRRHAWLA